MSVSEWSDRSRVLTKEYSDLPGPWRTERAPYLRDPMDAFKLRYVNRITLCFATQVGKTEVLFNTLGYAIDQDPGPGIIAYPTDTLAKDIGKGRVRSFINSCLPLLDKLNTDKTEAQRLYFTGVEIAIVGGNSPSQLASRPARYIWFDEADKFPLKSGNDANPFELASERTKTFHSRKEVMVSSPTYEDGHIWQSWISADARYRYFVPCPHCKGYQVMLFPNIKWPEELNSLPPAERKKRVTDESWYQCEYCGAKIYDLDKRYMLARGQWQQVEYNQQTERWEETKNIVKRPRHMAFNISTIYSPWKRFGDVAEKFLETKDKPEKLQSFVNGWLGEPWVFQSARMRSDIVMEKQLDYERGTVPEGALILTAFVDVQKDHFWWSVRAWGEGMTSWLIDYGGGPGICETWADIEDILNREYEQPVTGQLFRVYFALIDSGYKASEVYDFCQEHPGLTAPSKGLDETSARGIPYRVGTIDKMGYTDLKLYLLDTEFYKDFVFGRLNKEAGVRGSWNIFKDCPREYANQVCSEHKVKEFNRKGAEKEYYKKIHEGLDNHMLDCEVGNLAAAEIAGIRSMRAGYEEENY